MARYEGSAEDEAADRRGAKKAGVSRAAYENSAKDKREDARGDKHMKKHRHPRGGHMPKMPRLAGASAGGGGAPMPGPHEFSADQEQAMRGARSAGPAGPGPALGPPGGNPQGPPPGMDDEMGGM